MRPPPTSNEAEPSSSKLRPKPTMRGPRSDWFDSWDAAFAEAKRLGLTSYDGERREHYLAMPVRIEDETDHPGS